MHESKPSLCPTTRLHLCSDRLGKGPSIRPLWARTLSMKLYALGYPGYVSGSSEDEEMPKFDLAEPILRNSVCLTDAHGTLSAKLC